MPESLPPPVINTSPLIFLTRANLLMLLEFRYSEVLVPETVATEIQRYGTGDITTQALQQTAWLTVIKPAQPSDTLRQWNLDPGETSVLAWAFTHPGTEAILDDLAGRRCAQKLGIPIRGTLGLVLAAKQNGDIPEAKPILNQLRQTGMYLSDRVINKALNLVGESPP